jgi:hypothetical protein
MGQGGDLSSCFCLVVCPPVCLVSLKIIVTLVLCVFGRVEVEGEWVRLGGFWAEVGDGM